MSRAIIHVKTLSEVHEMFGLPKPRHPLISIIRHADMHLPEDNEVQWFRTDMFLISLKGKQKALLQYGRNPYDFQEGALIFIAPNQVFSTQDADFSETDDEWSILIHQDFVAQSDLGDIMSRCHFFHYESNESLHLSEDEQQSLTEIVRKIEKEYHQHIDKHTNEIISVNLASLLAYCQRYYDRQFITRKSVHKGVLVRFEKFLKDYFEHRIGIDGVPTVSQCGTAMNLSEHYLSDLLKLETGKTAKEHIDLCLVEKAKSLLLRSDQSVSEIAYALGFTYPNHFSKLFKNKMGISPSAYRQYNG